MVAAATGKIETRGVCCLKIANLDWGCHFFAARMVDDEGAKTHFMHEPYETPPGSYHRVGDAADTWCSCSVQLHGSTFVNFLEGRLQ